MEHTTDTWRKTAFYSKLESVHTQVLFLAGSQVIIQLDQLWRFHTLKRPPTSSFAWEKLAVAPKWPCICVLPALSSSFPNTCNPNPSLKESFQVPPPPEWLACSVTFCYPTLDPSGLPLCTEYGVPDIWRHISKSFIDLFVFPSHTGRLWCKKSPFLNIYILNSSLWHRSCCCC